VVGKEILMATVPVAAGLIIAALLFLAGLTGVLIRHNIMFILLSLEIMLNACGLAFVVAGSYWREADGQVMYFFVLIMAAAEMAVGLSLVLQMYHKFGTLYVNRVNTMRG
jgi:NADH-quinone oxidoreductase subunit K